MIFIELGPFARERDAFLDDASFARLQAALLANPRAGAVIPGTGGLRKLRWGAGGRGTRGGTRVIYYLMLARSRVLLLAIYGKSARDDLSADQKRILRRMVEGLREENEEE